MPFKKLISERQKKADQKENDTTPRDALIEVAIGDNNNDNRTGDFLNAINVVVNYFQENAFENPVILSSLLRVCADRIDCEYSSLGVSDEK